MKLLLLVALTMCAFAGNSVLNRAGVDGAGMDPMQFAVIRTAAGAVTLVGLLWLRGAAIPLTGGARLAGAASLAVYMVGFSAAYISLGAGLGALILFGVVQIVMFGWAVSARQHVPISRWLGMFIAFGGLALLLWPVGTLQVSAIGATSMMIAGVAWAVYTLLGQREAEPLSATAGNFVICLPFVCLALLIPSAGDLNITGTALAVLAGSLTSGLGYALWYRVLPQIPTTVAAIAQLCVPVIAILAGIVFLGEALDLKTAAATGLVLGGIALSVVSRR